MMEILIDAGKSPSEIKEILERGGLFKKGQGEAKIESHAQSSIGVFWNANENKWEKAEQINFFDKIDELDENKLWSSLGIKLSKNDSETILKDMKTITVEVKKISTELLKVTKSIDDLVAVIKSCTVENE